MRGSPNRRSPGPRPRNGIIITIIIVGGGADIAIITTTTIITIIISADRRDNWGRPLSGRPLIILDYGFSLAFALAARSK